MMKLVIDTDYVSGGMYGSNDKMILRTADGGKYVEGCDFNRNQLIKSDVGTFLDVGTGNVDELISLVKGEDIGRRFTPEDRKIRSYIETVAIRELNQTGMACPVKI